MMKRLSLSIFFLVLMLSLPSFLMAQEEEEEQPEAQSYEDLLFQEVEVENPVYYPVLSVGTGMLSYYGELNNNMQDFGTLPPLKINVYHFLDNQQNFRVNIFGMSGNLSGSFNELPEEDELMNKYNGITNFQTDILAMGLNLEYGFGHFYSQRPKFRPFLALGGEVLIYNPKSDYMKDGSPYDWHSEQIILRDYNYDYNLRHANLFDVSYNQNTPAVTLDVGFDFSLSSRVSVRVGASGHYTFTDLLDGIPYKDGDGDVVGNELPDYRDTEEYSSEGAIVNEEGEEMSDDEVISSMNYNLVAVDRSDAYMVPVTTSFSSKYTSVEGELEIPDKFKSVDKDNDGDISYDELLQAIDKFFNGQSGFIANEIYELNDFFFAQ